MEEKVEISKTEYDQLLRSAAELAALEAGGVSSWDWYYDSLRDAGLLDEDNE